MANQDIWEVANPSGGKMMFNLGLVLLFLGTLLYFRYPVDTVLMCTTFVLLIGLGDGMWRCEKQLNKRYDKNGNPKNSAF